MNLEIKNIDTFYILKGIMTAIRENFSAEAYDEIGVILDKQMMDTPECDATGNIIGDPVEQFKIKFNEMCPYDLSMCVYHPRFIELIQNFRNQIGEAMGPVSYAAYQLQEWLRDCPANCKEREHSWKWIWDWVKYYENNWRF